MAALLLFALAAGLSPTTLRPRAGLGRAGPLTAVASVASDWDERELWALEDSVPRYSLESGRFVLWRRMGADVPELYSRTPEELRTRWMILRAARNEAQEAANNPPWLENWHHLGDGRYQGELHGVAGVTDGSVRATVTRAQQREADQWCEAEQWCVRTSSGELFQLGGEGDAEDAPSGGELSAELSRRGGVSTAAAALRANAFPLAAGALAVGGAWAAFTSGHHVDVSIFIV